MVRVFLLFGNLGWVKGNTGLTGHTSELMLHSIQWFARLAAAICWQTINGGQFCAGRSRGSLMMMEVEVLDILWE
jgi:hypothetical protein